MEEQDRIKELEKEIEKLTIRENEICGDIQNFVNGIDNNIRNLNMMLFHRVWNRKFESDPGRTQKLYMEANRKQRKRSKMMPHNYMKIINEVINLSNAIRLEVKDPSKTLIDVAAKAEGTLCGILNMDYDDLFGYGIDPDLLYPELENIEKLGGDPSGRMPPIDWTPAPEKEMAP